MLETIIGIIIGFILNKIWITWKERQKRKKNLKQIIIELEANYYTIHQKKDHCKKIISNISLGKILPGLSVKFITTYYDNYLKDIYPYLNKLERNSLHVIYQYLKIIDSMLDNFERDIIYYLSSGLFKEEKDVFSIFKLRMTECLKQLSKTEQLIKKHLEGNPIDVLYINKKSKPENLL